MNLLIITRKVDRMDERMGFFCAWLLAFAKNLDHLYVICLERGNTDGLPSNVTIQSMGKELGYGKLRKYLRYRKLLKQVLPHVDGVFVHMNPLYVVAAAGLVKKYNKPMLLWYVHSSVDSMLRRSEKYVTGFITASRESFRLETKKPVHIVGHGIDAARFAAPKLKIKNEKLKTSSSAKATADKTEEFRILTVGRVSPSKHLEILIEATYELISKRQFSSFKLHILGAPALPSDQIYLESLKQLVRERKLEKAVQFLGPKTYAELPEYYSQANLVVNLSSTGSLDKAVLEAMASGRLVLTSNEAYASILQNLEPKLFLKERQPDILADKLVAINNWPPELRDEIAAKLQVYVRGHHDLDKTVTKIIKLYK